MSNYLGRKVKWVGEDGGWKTGRTVTLPDLLGIGNPAEVYFRIEGLATKVIKVIHDCDGPTDWIEENKLLPWPDVEYCSRCTKEKGKCECNPLNNFANQVTKINYDISKPKEFNKLDCSKGGKIQFNTWKPSMWIPELPMPPIASEYGWDKPTPSPYVPTSEGSKLIEEQEEANRKRNESLGRVTRKEVLQEAYKEPNDEDRPFFAPAY